MQRVVEVSGAGRPGAYGMGRCPRGVRFEAASVRGSFLYRQQDADGPQMAGRGAASVVEYAISARSKGLVWHGMGRESR